MVHPLRADMRYKEHSEKETVTNPNMPDHEPGPLRFDRILLPVEFSEPEITPVRHAAALARKFNSELTMLHVNQILLPGGLNEAGEAHATGWIKSIEAQRKHDLNDYLPEEFEGVKLRRVVLSGDPAEKIVETAREEGDDLIVIATRGYGNLRRYLLGSVTAKVLHDTETPVWTGAHLRDPELRRWHDIKNIICGLDDSSNAAHVLDTALQLARLFQAHLTVCHVLPELWANNENPVLSATDTDAAEEKIHTMLAARQASAEINIGRGEANVVLSDLAGRKNAQLIVIGRSGTSETGRLRHNSYTVIRDAPCAVLSI